MPLTGPRQRSAAGPLAAVWTLLIVYASLFPFSDWRWPPGAAVPDLLVLPFSLWTDAFDIAANLLGYLPLGLLVALAARSRGRGRIDALLRAMLVGTALSYAMESLQHCLPQRVPSSLDWLLNSTGAALGGLLALAADTMGWPRAWARTHDRWLDLGGAGALLLLLLWPVALLFPAPVPLGLGQVGARLRDALFALFDDVPWAAPLVDALGRTTPPRTAPLSNFAEGAAVTLGLLAPVLLAFAASRPGLRRLLLALIAPLLAALATTLSTALNFGPAHAWAWRTPTVLAAMGVATLIALALVWVGPRLAAGLALVVLGGLIVIVQQAPTDPYFAQSLQAWERGRFIRFHGLAQWVGWLWPYAALGWLLGRLGDTR